MKYLFYDNNGKVTLIYHVKPPKEVGNNYVTYDGEVPQKEEFVTIIKVNPETEEVYFEFEDIPISEEEKQHELVNILGQELATLKIQLIMGGVI